MSQNDPAFTPTPVSAQDKEPSPLARQLDQSGKILQRLGRPNSRRQLIDWLCRDEGGFAFQQMRLSAAIELHDFDEADQILLAIDTLQGLNETQRRWLDQQRNALRAPPLDLQWLQAAITARNPPQLTPVPKRICYILHNSLPFSSGGYATRAHGLALGLRAAGFDVRCVTRPGFPVETVDIDPLDVPLIEEIGWVEYRRVISPSRREVGGGRYVKQAAQAIEVQLRDLRPEIVIAASNHLTAHPAQIAARRLGIPFVYEVRGFWEVTRASREPAFRSTASFKTQAKLEAMCASAADHVFTLTEGMREELERRGVPSAKISLLPNSCDPDQFAPRGRDTDLAQQLAIPVNVPVIGYVGSFVQYEGLDDLTAACAALKSRGVGFRLLLVGNENVSSQEKGPITEAIEALAAKAGLSDWLIMPGRVPHEMVSGYYSLIDIAAFPRKPQPVTEMVSPMKPLEAMAMKKAVVASSVRALSEMVQHGETGLLFEKGDIVSLADRLQQLIENAALRERLGEAGRRWVEMHRTWSITAHEARTVIDGIDSVHGAAPDTATNRQR
ncbi:glycosyltransferase family 4 protein [Paracoccus albus]|uniref:glycosyltransferase family 4 protein n=1 Tax=Paracoccus albus TaxID=3017784 RepID=UPI0022F0841C|nr:glycosyltransferase family 4 protein [Paracoccus albus]WBU62045.1 glycosyltransferase family 4 protein [Paracoccus albus]